MACELRISGTEPESIVDGRGIRYVIFTQGCPHHCPGCHNPQTHPFDGGKSADIQKLYEEICENPLLKGVTFSGGEPFCQPAPLAKLAAMVHAHGLDITTYTGYLYEDLLAKNEADVNALLAATDILIDGPFLQEQKDLTLLFRGSRNQRVIDLNATRGSGAIVLADPD
jgi:anaerobic ribonucleoside-triphosphate reductase activating protein